VRIDQAELGGRHAELGACGTQPHIAADGELEATTQAVAVDRGEDRIRVRADCLHRRRERMGDQRLRVLFEARVVDAADVVAGGERPTGAGDHDAAGLDAVCQRRQRLGDRIEDLVVQWIALFRIVQREPRDSFARLIQP
jgi:hypothetical protein